MPVAIGEPPVGVQQTILARSRWRAAQNFVEIARTLAREDVLTVEAACGQRGQTVGGDLGDTTLPVAVGALTRTAGLRRLGLGQTRALAFRAKPRWAGIRYLCLQIGRFLHNNPLQDILGDSVGPVKATGPWTVNKVPGCRVTHPRHDSHPRAVRKGRPPFIPL